MPQSDDPKLQIVHAAISLLKQLGMEGLTMRKVAAEAGRSLGNVQYHFKDKTALMAGLADHYFTACSELLEAYAQENGSAVDPETGVRGLIAFYMDPVDHLTDMCRIFRELWALSTRSSDLHEQLIRYYRRTTEQFASLFSPIGFEDQRATRLASLLIPYFEGYSIAGEALPMDKAQVSEMLVRLCMAEHTK